MLTSDCGSVSTAFADCEWPIHVGNVILDILIRKLAAHQTFGVIDCVCGIEEHLHGCDCQHQSTSMSS